MLTRSLAPGLEVYGEKRITVENSEKGEDGAPVSTKVEYRVWNPFRSKLAAGIIGKHMRPVLEDLLLFQTAQGFSVRFI